MLRGAPQVLATEVGVVEGPLWFDGSLWCTRISHGGAILQLTERGAEDRIDTGGGANGLAVDRHGTFWIANDGGRGKIPSCIQRAVPDRQGGVVGAEAVIEDVGGRPFRHCNDLCFGPDGFLYFTDSGENYSASKALVDAGKPPELPGFVCRLNPEDRSVEVVDESLYMPNGLAFSPDNRYLYVSDTVAHEIVAFPWDDGRLGPRERTLSIDGNPDGFCFGNDGRIYTSTAIAGEIHVITQEGVVDERIRWADDAIPLNCCFGGTDGSTLYVTDAGGMPNVAQSPDADRSLERLVALPMDVAGLPLHG